MNAMKLGLCRDTERPIYAAHDTQPAPALPDFGELTLPAPEVPPTQPALPVDDFPYEDPPGLPPVPPMERTIRDDDEDEEPESEECEVCSGSGALEVVPSSWTFPGEFEDCWNCHGEGRL